MADNTKRDLKFFMREQTEEVVKVPGPESMKDDDGNVIMLEVRILSNERIQQLNEKYRDRKMATDKRGNPIVYNGEIVHDVKKDSAKASRHIMVEALAYPNLGDPELMKFYNCVDVTEMPFKVFSRADEYAHVNRAVMAVLGLGPALSDEEEKLLEEAKN